MPRRSLVLEDNQRSIITLLPNCPTHTKPECMEYDPTILDMIGDVDIEVIDIEDKKKLKREKGNTDRVEALKKNPIKNP